MSEKIEVKLVLGTDRHRLYDRPTKESAYELANDLAILTGGEAVWNEDESRYVVDTVRR